MTQLPVLSNFVPFGQAPNVVGGKPVYGGERYDYHWSRSRVVAAGSADIPTARAVQIVPGGGFDSSGPLNGSAFEYGSGALPREGVQLPDGGFTDTLFGGFVIYQRAKEIDGLKSRATEVTDNQVAVHREGDTLSAAADGYWWVEYDSLVTIPAANDPVFVDNVTAGFEGRLSAAVGVQLLVEDVTFMGYVLEGLDGLPYAAVKFNRPIV